jgi:hypothetical protein
MTGHSGPAADFHRPATALAYVPSVIIKEKAGAAWWF